jgi:hypothetical protein
MERYLRKLRVNVFTKVEDTEVEDLHRIGFEKQPREEWTMKIKHSSLKGTFRKTIYGDYVHAVLQPCIPRVIRGIKDSRWK